MKKNSLTIPLLAFLLAALSACDFVQSLVLPATPTAVIMADWFFHGCAYVDGNGNGEIDADDEPLAGAMLLVHLKSQAGFGSPTYSSGCATAVVPGGLDEDHWPVTLRMNPPRDSEYELVGPEGYILEYPGSRGDFLFTHP